MKEQLIQKFNALGIKDMPEVTELHELKGDFVNLECKLPNGQRAKILDDSKTYFGAELCKKDSVRCYGLAADEGQMIVYEYGDGGSEAELVIWKRL